MKTAREQYIGFLSDQSHVRYIYKALHFTGVHSLLSLFNAQFLHLNMDFDTF